MGRATTLGGAFLLDKITFPGNAALAKEETRRFQGQFTEAQLPIG
jgi:hypothetical protein